MVPPPILKVDDSVLDDEWDRFLEASASGQFQQSSIWAGAKQPEGWRVRRGRWMTEGGILGGFQILYRDTRVGRVGYVSKGPVIAADEGMMPRSRVLGELVQVASSAGLAALIVQLPDKEADIDAQSYEAAGFVRERWMGVVTATLWLPLSATGDLIDQVPKPTRNPIRQAQRKGLEYREGSRADLANFFALMTSTCRRQGVKPNPSSLAELRSLFDAFDRVRGARLGFVCNQGTPISGALCLDFGERTTIWKKGWDSSCSDRHPNHLLYFRCFEGARARGSDFFDFSSLDRRIAERMTRGEDSQAERHRSRDRFHLSFGAKAVLLPQPWIWFRNPLFRCVYAMTTVLTRLRS